MTIQNTHISFNKDQVFKGIACAVTAFFMFTVMQAIGKFVSDDHSVFEIGFYRSLVAFLLMGAWLAYKRTPRDFFIPKKPITLFFRVFVGIYGLVLTFAAVKYLPMADATVLFMLAVLITPAMAVFFLKENVGPHRWTAIIVGLIGVIILVRPSGDIQLLGFILAICAASTHAAVQIFLRLLKEEDPQMIIFYFFAGGIILTAPFLFFESSWPTPMNTLFLIGVGITGGIGQWTLTLALKYAPASTISPYAYTGLIWATLFDILFWGYIPGLPVFGGAALIVLAQLYIIYRERKKNIKNEQKPTIP